MNNLLRSNFAHFLGAGSLSVLLRALSLGSKFVLMIVLAKVLPVEDVGLYGLVVATVGFSITLLGLDFYTFSSRDLLSKPHGEWPFLIRDQFSLYLIVYLLLLPLVSLVFFTRFLPWALFGWFYVILALEHISQECYRLLVVLGKPLLAAWNLFFRYGAWAYLLAVFFWFSPEASNLNWVWFGWALGGCASIVFSLWGIRELDWKVTEGRGIDWTWIKKGLAVAIPFLLGTLALRGLFTFDRYILDHYQSRQDVGIYSLFMGMAFALNSFVDSGVVTIYYPKIVSSFRQGQTMEYRKLLKEMFFSVALTVGLFLLCSYAFVTPLLQFVGRPLYIEHLNVFWVLSIGIGIYCFSLVPHLGLYARGADIAIMIFTLGSLVVFLTLAFILTPTYGVIGVAVSQALAMLFFLVSKGGFLWKKW